MPKKLPNQTRAELLNELDALPLDSRINETHVAARLNCSIAKVRRDRVVGGGVPFIAEGGTVTTAKNGNVRRFGGRVHYIKADLLKFLENHNRTYSSTSEVTAHQGGVSEMNKPAISNDHKQRSIDKLAQGIFQSQRGRG